MADVASVLSELLPAGRVTAGAANEDYWHDEALGSVPQCPPCPLDREIPPHYLDTRQRHSMMNRELLRSPPQRRSGGRCATPRGHSL